MNSIRILLLGLAIIAGCFSCISEKSAEASDQTQMKKEMTAKDILGDPSYRAISYGGYRDTSRNIQPTVEELKEDMRIMHAMGIRLLRTYNVKQYAHASNVLRAIHEIKEEDPNFEMYVMLGAWINCRRAYTGHPDHYGEDEEDNRGEILRAAELAKQYPDIVKIIAVGNEAMVKWAASYFVQADVILRWVNLLQEMKQNKELDADLWITSSDNFASWGGGDTIYHTPALEALVKAVDFVSLHTYPMHDTHYNPNFWGVEEEEMDLSAEDQIRAAMQRALEYAQSQYQSVAAYVSAIDPEKPIHIGETGWATASNGHYGGDGSKATDEFKEGLYHELIRNWTDEAGISCFYFQAFDEPWKDAGNPGGSENHFGVITVDGQAKYAVWDLVDEGRFEGLTRGGNPIVKTHGGDLSIVKANSPVPPMRSPQTVH